MTLSSSGSDRCPDSTKLMANPKMSKGVELGWSSDGLNEAWLLKPMGTSMTDSLMEAASNDHSSMCSFWLFRLHFSAPELVALCPLQC